MRFPRVIIAGLRGGSGKTTLSLGLIRALASKGMKVIPFKKGPDYIDAGWLASAAGRPCYNLDPFLIGEENIIPSFVGHFGDSDVAVIEGNRGLFDGMDSEGSLSTASLAKTLKSPVILIIDCTKMTRTTAAIVAGVEKFDPRLRLAGVVLNQIAGKRHESVIRESIERYCKAPVLGALPKSSGVRLPERHMGLTPFQEHSEVEDALDKVSDFIKKHVDIDAVLKVMRDSRPLHLSKREIASASPRNDNHSLPLLGKEWIKGKVIASDKLERSNPVRVGIIKDSAFQFYYPENFEELQRRGAELVEISALTEDRLPEIDALYIGGGFPETHAVALAGNVQFRKSLRRAVERGLPVYAECGGLMYLGKSLSVGGEKYPMAGVLPVSFTLEKRPQAHGYTVAEVSGKNPFYKKGTVIRGHEFHYSAPIISPLKREHTTLALKMKRGEGISGKTDGLCYKNVFASYTHIHALGTPQWADGIIRAARAYRDSLKSA